MNIGFRRSSQVVKLCPSIPANKEFHLTGQKCTGLCLSKMSFDNKEVNTCDKVVTTSSNEAEIHSVVACADKKVVRKLLRKLDFIVLPTLTMMYIFK